MQAIEDEMLTGFYFFLQTASTAAISNKSVSYNHSGHQLRRAPIRFRTLCGQITFRWVKPRSDFKEEDDMQP